MSITEEIKNIDSNIAISVSIFFFSLIGSGFLTVFLFKRVLFINLDTLKLIILSVSISVPGVILPIFVTFIAANLISRITNINGQVLGNSKEWFYRHGISNAIFFYMFLFISYIFEMSFLTFAWCFLSSIVVSCIWEVLYLVKRAKNPENYPPIVHSANNAF